ncbi:aromatic peroxygenase precursor [Coprinopsis marcescibilis]|uniref:Aromatic peroxygenase n=1 Tax=Coprinopsis marcescibilis TaxID=230819 RepID=A0A5C3KD48_COPMA|nr:aromatic peroxygenase precursor [Coprinopsis marcescibilis]
MAVISLKHVLVAVALVSSTAQAFPAYGSLAGLSEREFKFAMSTLKPRIPAPAPGPLRFDGPKLAEDREHAFKPMKKDDLRGPCPGLNTLAAHGYLPRNGVATPAEIIQASMEGFNMENNLARFTTYAAHLLDGNVVTDLLSIGAKTPKTGPDPDAVALVAGLRNHGTFEGDASVTRADAFFGDNFSFNQTLFDQFVDFSDRFGNGFYNYSVAAELRFHRVQQGIAENPHFSFAGFRHLTAYAEVTFPVNMFIDGRRTGFERLQLDMQTAETFFKDNRFPKGFFRSEKPSGTEGLDQIFIAHPTQPGRNAGAVNTFTVDNSLGDLGSANGFCSIYTGLANVTIPNLYPNPTGVLRRNLITNLQFLFDGLPKQNNCTQIFPFGSK